MGEEGRELRTGSGNRGKLNTSGSVYRAGRYWEHIRPILWQDSGSTETDSWSLIEGFRLPAMDVYDRKDHIVVKAEVPGIDKKNIKVRVEGNILSIRGETKKEREAKKKDYYCCERAYGSFYRTIPLPVAVEKEKVKASYKDGILTIELPKSKAALSKETDIQTE